MKILSSEEAELYQIDSLQRGHVLFTSFISFKGKLLFLDSHIERLVKGAHFLFPNYGWEEQSEKIKQYVVDYLKNSTEHFEINYYFRLTIFDDCIHLQQKKHYLCDDSLKLMSAVKIKTLGLIPQFLKLSNYVEADLEIARAKAENFEDVLYFDINKNITEASTSNIFIVNAKGGIMTPAPSSIVLDGIIRKKLIEKLKKQGLQVKETDVTKSEIICAREIWLTNSIKGVRFVKQFNDIIYQKNESLFLKVISDFGRYGELV